jgi:leader peptidase (prepilin peptidase) / N-methyltransferase
VHPHDGSALGVAAGAGVAGLAVGAVVGRVVGTEVRRLTLATGRRPPIFGVAVATAAAFMLLVQRFGLSPSLGVYLVLFTGLVALGAIDLECHELPNRVLGATTAVVAMLMIVDATMRARWGAAGAAVGAGVISGCAMWSVWRSHRGGLGFGDVRLAALVGLGAAWSGSPPEALLLAAVALGVACLSGLLVALGALALGGVRTLRFPFGPCLAAGALWAVLWGQAAVQRLALH